MKYTVNQGRLGSHQPIAHPATSHQPMMPHGIMFHHFHGGDRLPQQGSISADDLERILRGLGSSRILDPATWMERLETSRLDSSDLCLTFDDGLLCQFDVALPVLERHNLRAFWFVYSSVFEGHVEKMEVYRFFRSQFFKEIDHFYALFFDKVSRSAHAERARQVATEEAVEVLRHRFPFYSQNDARFRLIRDQALTRHQYEHVMDEILRERRADPTALAKGLWMTDDHLRYLTERGHIIGLHSYSHPTSLARLPRERQWAEYDKNMRHIWRVCGISPTVAAHPCDSYNDDTLEILRVLGVRCAFRSHMSTRRNEEALNPSSLEIAREDHANLLSRVS